MDLIKRIDRWADISPDAVAHRSGELRLTYGELRQRSDSLAAHLTQAGGNDLSPIAVLGHREPEMLIGFLGCVKAGRPYVPIDTLLPQQRIDHILTIAGARLLLTPKEIATRTSTPAKPPQRCPRKEDVFYILFTSGSTGEPKGVPITHGCLQHFVDGMCAEQRFADLKETFLNQAPFSFDLSVMDLYCSLVTGGTLFSIDRSLIENPRRLFAALAHSGLTAWVSTPSFVKFCLSEKSFEQKLLPNLRRFLFCGETLGHTTAQVLRERFPDAAIWNTYGPTEATVATTSVCINDHILNKYDDLPLGRALPGTNVFIAQGSNPLPENVTGEIVIAGPNVSPGYLGSPSLSEGRFFMHGGERAFRTGDYGRFSDGLLFFQGRIDDQVKLNGYRIELGDIEGNLRALPGVHDAIAVPVTKKGRVTSLAAFVVPEHPNDMSSPAAATELRKLLRQRVPDYMLPSRIRFLDAIPLTRNGKADRAGLAALL